MTRKTSSKFRLAFALALALLASIALDVCSKPAPPLSGAARIGQKVYMSICVACHNVDPRFPGATGPDLQGASLELTRMKTQQRSYPAGYKPKRQTKDMPIFILTEAEILGLHAFLNHSR